MKSLIKKSLTCALAATTLFAAVGCGGGEDPNKNKATLYVYSFTSGFGSEWLTSLIADYEKLVENVEVDGKKGIHIEPTAEKSDVTGPQMAGRQEVVYFLEQKDYYELLAGNYVADITEAVTKENPYDGKTLESKMFADQKSYLGRQVNGETHYYAYPHYFTGFGIVYDVELFESRGYYFIDGHSQEEPTQDNPLSNKFVSSKNDTKSAGPDGIYNSAETPSTDDGLPATYKEFLWLCDYISNQDNPLIWSGLSRESYLTHFINALATDYEGKEQMRLNFSFDGEANNLGTLQGGQFVKDAEPTMIDGTNGAELARQAGKYYAMDFYEDLYSKTYIKGAESTLYSSTYTHLKAQEDFLKKSTRRNAMLVDGSWWQMEATTTFNNMAKANPANSKQNRKLAWMPLPKQSAEKVGEKATMYDIMYPLCIMKNGLDKNSWQYKYALDFIQFANSDEQLAKFTQITGCTKALDYTLTNDQYKSLSYFGKTFYDAYKSSDVLFPYDNNLLFANNQKVFQELDPGTGSPLYKSTAYTTSFVKAIEKDISAATYFSGMHDYFNELTIWKKAK